jgi:hypothetical protein
MKADAVTGLASPDVFYFGNLVGFAGEAAINGIFKVTSADQLAARLDLHSFLNPALITNAHDYSRDGRVDATDEIIAAAQITAGSSLISLQPAAAPALVESAATPGTATDSALDQNAIELPAPDLSTLIDGEGIQPFSRHRRRPLFAAATAVDAIYKLLPVLTHTCLGQAEASRII